MGSAHSNMEAIVKTRSGVQLARVARPRVRDDFEVEVAPVRAGLCRTDLHVAFGRTPCVAPRILGHEIAGVVTAVGARVRRTRMGDRVAVNPLLPCGTCSECVRARACTSPRMLGLDADGAFAQTLVVPERAVYRVPDSMSFERAAYVEPVAATLAVVGCPISREMRGLVLGSGRIAELTNRVLTAHGFDGVTTHPIGPALPALSFDWVIDTVGSSASLDAAMRALRQRGLLVLKSRPAAPAALDVAFAVQRELALHAVRYAPFDDAIELLSSTSFVVEDLFGETYPLAAFGSVFEQAEVSETSKVFFAPNPERG